MRLFVSLAFIASCAFAAANDSQQSVLNKLPLRFERDSEHLWVARGFGFGVYVGREATAVSLGKEAIGVRFAGADSKAPFQGENKSATPSNHFMGSNSYSADAFMRLRRPGIYPGIDVVYYGVGQSLEYDFELAPGADPSKIRMQFDGVQSSHVDDHGSVVLTLANGEVTQKAPVTYQRLSTNELVAVNSRYVREADGTYSLALDAYDVTRPLVIDPQILYSTYFSGSAVDVPISISRDKNGAIYIAGLTSSNDFPLVGEAYSGFLQSPNPHIFTTKIDPFAPPSDVISYSGYFGGMFGDILRAAVADSEGVFYMTGVTDDFYFPTTTNAYSQTNGETRKMFLSRLDTKLPGTSGLTYSTFFGGTGTEEPTAIALGPTPGRVYITGFTNGADYPVKNAYRATLKNQVDGFVATFDLTKSGADSLVASTYIGGSFYDYPRSIAVDADGKTYIAGYTFSYDLPMAGNSYRGGYSGTSDGFLLKFDLSAATLEYGTFLGGASIDQIWKILVDPQGRVALAGYSLSDDFPITSGAFQQKQNGGGDAFLSILDIRADPSRQLAYSTFYGGSGGDFIYDMRVAPSGYYYLGGYTLSRDLPVVDALRPASARGGTDGFVAIVDTGETADRSLLYSSYVTGPGEQVVQGIEVDPVGNVYVTGQAYDNIFEPFQAPPEGSNTNVFFFVFRPSPPPALRQQSRTVLTAPATRTRR